MRRGALTGLSVEFHALRETRSADGLRVLQRAAYPAVGLVDRGSYRTSVELRQAAETLNVESRARMGRSIAAPIPTGRRLACECSGPGCRFAEFASEGLQDAFDEAFAEHAETVATWANYNQPLGSVGRGTLRRTGPTEATIDLPDDDYGRAALAAHESTGVVVRPYLDPVDSVGTREGETMVYERPVIRAFVVSATDKRSGWPEPKITATPRRGRAPSPPETAVAVTLSSAALATAIRQPAEVAARLLAVATELVERYAPAAPEAIQNEAVIRCAGYLAQQPSDARRSTTVGGVSSSWAVTHMSALRHSGGMALLSPWKRRRAGSIG